MPKGGAQSAQDQTKLEAELREGLRLSMQGERPAYEAFLEKVAVMMRAYLSHTQSYVRRNPEKVEELVQEVLLAIHLKKATYRSEMPILPWLYTIAKYRLIDSIRADARRPQTTDWEDGLLADQALLANSPDALDGSLLVEARQELEAALSGLSDKQRQVLVMAKAEDVPLAEIGMKMKMSVSAVKVTVHRAISGIRTRSEKGARREDP